MKKYIFLLSVFSALSSWGAEVLNQKFTIHYDSDLKSPVFEISSDRKTVRLVVAEEYGSGEDRSLKYHSFLVDALKYDSQTRSVIAEIEGRSVVCSTQIYREDNRIFAKINQTACPTQGTNLGSIEVGEGFESETSYVGQIIFGTR